MASGALPVTAFLLVALGAAGLAQENRALGEDTHLAPSRALGEDTHLAPSRELGEDTHLAPSRALGKTVTLPRPLLEGAASLEAALAARRSVRDYAPDPISLAQVAQLLWAAQGITGAEGERSAPSAGALYPLEIHLVAGKVDGLAAGVYRYRPREHALHREVAGDQRVALADAALDQRWIADAPAVIAIAALPARTTRKYGRRGKQYVAMEAGHAAQNVYLQAFSLGLGTVVVGAFRDAGVRSLLELREGEQPLALMPVGRPR